MFVTAILLAAGLGQRFKSRVPKPLAEIDSKPVIFYSLSILNKHALVRDIVLVVSAKDFKLITDKVRGLRISKIRQVVEGGRRRQDSVLCGLRAVEGRTDLVLIHDAARPFIDKRMISDAVKEARVSGAAVVGVPVKATIKEAHPSTPLRTGSSSFDSAQDRQLILRLRSGQAAHGKILVKKTLNRNNLWEIQTPQVFRPELILKAFLKFGDNDVTDDAALVEKFGAEVSIVPGSYDNIKITTPEDLIIARAILAARKVRS